MNYITNNCNGCYSCSTNLKCPGNCSISQLEPYCLSCNSCSYGCVDDKNCNLCKNKLCYSCSDFEGSCSECNMGAVLINSSCDCKNGLVGSFYNCSQFITCFEGCKRCKTSSVFDCYECNAGLVLLQGVCVKIPLGYNTITNKTDGLLVFSMKLTQILGLVYDSISSVPVLTGSSTNFYPFFDSDDPYPAYLRGYFFNGYSSIMRMPEYKNYKSPALLLPST